MIIYIGEARGVVTTRRGVRRALCPGKENKKNTNRLINYPSIFKTKNYPSIFTLQKSQTCAICAFCPAAPSIIPHPSAARR